MDGRDARRPSRLDVIAAGVVAAGGGIQDVLAADLRSLESVVGSIDPAILERAYDNDVLRESPVEQGGGMKGVVEATGLRTVENEPNMVDSESLARADHARPCPIPEPS